MLDLNILFFQLLSQFICLNSYRIPLRLLYSLFISQGHILLLQPQQMTAEVDNLRVCLLNLD